MKAIRWFEIVAEFVEEDCASYGRLAWAAKDKIVGSAIGRCAANKKSTTLPYDAAGQDRAIHPGR